MFTRTGRILLTVLLLGVSFASCKASELDNSLVTGVYESISESEWNLVIQLNNDMGGAIQLESWDAGNYDNREIKKYDLRWNMDGEGIITLTFDNHQEKVRFHQNLSMADAGKKEAKPGLEGLNGRGSLIDKIKLWKKDNK